MPLQTTDNLILDVKKTIVQSVRAKQYDNNTRYINVKLVDDNEFIDMTGYSVIVKLLTANNRAIMDYAEVQPDGTANITLTNNILYDSGKTKAEIIVMDGSQTISSTSFFLQVEPSVYDDERVISTDEFSVLIEALEDLEDIKTSELTRISNENTRISNEETRQSNEAIRISNENTRISNETTRQTNETTRQTNETSRISTMQQIESDLATLENELDDVVLKTQLGVPSTSTTTGVATLDNGGHVPEFQLPSYVDDVLEGRAQNVSESQSGSYTASAFILTGESSACIPETGKIYLDIVDEIQYRWSGSIYVSIGSHLALGETSSTAYAGNKGKANADNISALQNPSFVEAGTRNNISSGESYTTILGKIKKFFSDLKTVAFTGSYNDLTNKPEHLGHSIVNKLGTVYPDRSKLCFGDGFKITDYSNSDMTSIQKDSGMDSYYTYNGGYFNQVQTVGDNFDDNDVLDGHDKAIAALIEGKNQKPTITYAQWQQYTDEQKQAFVGYISGYPSEVLNASNVPYGNSNVGAELDRINSDLADKQDSNTAVKHTASTAVGSTTQPVYVDDNGDVKPTSYSVAKSVPSDAKFSDTTYSVATTSADGLMSSSDKTKLNGIAAGAQVNSITGVKGSAESSYRTGNVNITPANIGLGNVNNTADANKSVNYATSAGSASNATKWSGLTNDLGTNNTTDSWVLVLNGSKVQHKEINQNLNTYNSPTFSSVNVSGEVFKSTATNVQIQANNNNSTCYLRAGSVECIYVSSFEKRPIYASSFVVGSSRRIKENIVDMTNEEANKILDVKVVDFDYIKEVGGQKNQHGVIAEDVKEIIPSVVTIPEEDDGKCYDKVPSVDYSKFVPYLIKTVQIQQKEIYDLKERLDTLM